MPKGLIIPLQLAPDGTFAVTDDPAILMRQRIIDIVATSNFERVHRVNWGCDLQGFLFDNAVDHLMGAKAEQIRATLTTNLTYGKVIRVDMHPYRETTGGAEVVVHFQVYEGGPIATVATTIQPETQALPQGEMP